MLSGVLRSKTAVAVNIAIMRAFVELRRVAASYTAIERRLEDFERETKATLGEHDEQLDEIFEALRQLISPPPQPKRPVGFRRQVGSRNTARAALVWRQRRNFSAADPGTSQVPRPPIKLSPPMLTRWHRGLYRALIKVTNDGGHVRADGGVGRCVQRSERGSGSESL
jgi:hypothetical protein